MLYIYNIYAYAHVYPHSRRLQGSAPQFAKLFIIQTTRIYGRYTILKP